MLSSNKIQALEIRNNKFLQRMTIKYLYIYIYMVFWAFPSSLDRKASACNVGDLGSISQLGRFLKDGSGNPL